ncbi:MAG: hypothetical protein ACI35W_06855 [Anaeroplasmataceae bacterium]
MKKILSIIMIIFPLFILNKSYCATGSSYCVLEESTLRVLEGKNEHNISLIASTTKNNKLNHGYGLKNVKAIV